MISALLLGVAGGWHCAGMCTAFVAAGQRGAAGAVALLSRRELRQATAMQQVGRLVSYACLGALAGSVSTLAGHDEIAGQIRAAMFAAANLVMLAMGIQALRGVAGFPVLEAIGARLGHGMAAGIVSGLAGAVSGRPLWRAFVLGIAWGSVPCALIYSALTLALFAGGPAGGALVMASLWLGTLPVLVGIGFAMSRLERGGGHRRLAALAGTLMVVFALLGLYRALAGTGTGWLDAFCRLP